MWFATCCMGSPPMVPGLSQGAALLSRAVPHDGGWGFSERRRFSETRAFAPPGRKSCPARLFHRPTEPFAQSAAHHPGFVLRRQPRNIFREHRNGLCVGTRQTGQIRSPEHPSWAVCIIDAAEVRVKVPVGVVLGAVSRKGGHLDRDVRPAGHRQYLVQAFESFLVFQAAGNAQVVKDKF